MALLSVLEVSKIYRLGEAIIPAVSNVTLEIEAGEFIAISGRSGSGKSTLMSLLGLLDRPSAGRLLLNNVDVAGLSEQARAGIRNRQLGFVFQLPSLLARSSALENVELPLVYAGLRRADRDQRARTALDRVGLAHRLRHWPHQLSGGEQQRVAIARALVNDPALILADEPTGSLDSRTGEAVLALLEDLNRDGRTIVIVTHATEVAERTRRRITLHDGKVLADERLVQKNAVASGAAP
jgi:putative ABC transport system ATP-binding protein